MAYDSRPDTWEHIHKVRGYIGQVVRDLLDRADAHDQSKLSDPELAVFDEVTPKLAVTTYGSDEYRNCLKGMEAGLGHHYRVNDHHPEHFENLVWDMSLVQVLEMLCDWKAATERHPDGDLERSIRMNRERFEYGPEVERLLLVTARDMGWIP